MQLFLRNSKIRYCLWLYLFKKAGRHPFRYFTAVNFFIFFFLVYVYYASEKQFIWSIQYDLPYLLNISKLIGISAATNVSLTRTVSSLYPQSIIAHYEKIPFRCSVRPFREHIIEALENYGNKKKLLKSKIVQLAASNDTLTVQFYIGDNMGVVSKRELSDFLEMVANPFKYILIVETKGTYAKSNLKDLTRNLQFNGKSVVLHLSNRRNVEDTDLRAYIYHKAKNLAVTGGSEGAMAALISNVEDGIHTFGEMTEFLKVYNFRHAISKLHKDNSNAVLNGMGKVFPTCCEFTSFGTGDSAKYFCKNSPGFMEDPCWVLSLGCNNKWGFEEGVFERTNCRIQVFDCTGNFKVPTSLQSRVTIHKLCVGLKGEKRKEFVTLKTLIEIGSVASGLPNGTAPTVAKMDVEGWEFPVLTTMAQEFVNAKGLPKQLEFELHARTHIHVGHPWQQVSSKRYTVNRADVHYLVQNLSSIGYVLVHRADNPYCLHCSEVTFLHQSAIPSIQ